MKKLSAPTANRRAAAQSKQAGTKKAHLAAWLEHTRPPLVGEGEWAALCTALAPISETYLRRLLRAAGIPMEPIVEGVRQESLDALESSLLKMAVEYECGDRERRALVRGLVIAAREHARWASRNPARRSEKQEMTLWMTTWLENPPLFVDWIGLRRAAIRDS